MDALISHHEIKFLKVFLFFFCCKRVCASIYFSRKKKSLSTRIFQLGHASVRHESFPLFSWLLIKKKVFLLRKWDLCCSYGKTTAYKHATGSLDAKIFDFTVTAVNTSCQMNPFPLNQFCFSSFFEVIEAASWQWLRCIKKQKA